MRSKVPAEELDRRLGAFRKRMDAVRPDWELALIISKVNQYYFTGTMQDGLLMIKRDADAVFYVRRSYARALDESEFRNIEPMESYRDISPGKLPKTVYLETESIPLALFKRLQKYFYFEAAESLDRQLALTRAVKSVYELELLKRAGEKHRKVLEDLVPGMLREGMSEAELSTGLYSAMMAEGHHGVARLGMFDTEMLMGHICFGESSIYPSYFDGPGGIFGLCAAVPLGGSRERRLKKGDLVFVDTAFGFEGYHTDKTSTYMFGRPLSDDVVRIHQKCLDIQDAVAELLRPGNIPAEIYKEVIEGLDEGFARNFMGYGSRKARFIGHGTGLQVDEYPVIAEGFKEPMAEGMVLALEPKAGIENVGMVGIENTFFVSEDGGECITGSNRGLIMV